MKNKKTKEISFTYGKKENIEDMYPEIKPKYPYELVKAYDSVYLDLYLKVKNRAEWKTNYRDEWVK